MEYLKVDWRGYPLYIYIHNATRSICPLMMQSLNLQTQNHLTNSPSFFEIINLASYYFIFCIVLYSLFVFVVTFCLSFVCIFTSLQRALLSSYLISYSICTNGTDHFDWSRSLRSHFFKVACMFRHTMLAWTTIKYVKNQILFYVM